MTQTYEIFDCFYMRGIDGHTGPFITLADALDMAVRRLNGNINQVSSVICESTQGGYVPFLELSKRTHKDPKGDIDASIVYLALHTCTAKRLG